MMSVYANQATKTLPYEPQHEEREETPVVKPPKTLETIALDDSTDEVIEDNAVREFGQSLEMAMASIKSVSVENIDASCKRIALDSIRQPAAKKSAFDVLMARTNDDKKTSVSCFPMRKKNQPADD
ncbi:hypothetical protein TKK_0019032 [Trichogramma kaykai]